MLLRVPSGYQHWPLQWCNTWPYHALFWLNVLVWALYTACLRRACAFQDLLVCRANTTLIDRCIDQIKIKKSDGLFDPLFCIMQCTCVRVCCYQSFLLCQNSKPTFWPRSPAQARQLDAAGMTYIRAHIQLTRMSFRCLGRLRLSWTNHWPKTNASSLQCEATKSRVDHPAKAPCSLAAVSKFNFQDLLLPEAPATCPGSGPHLQNCAGTATLGTIMFLSLWAPNVKFLDKDSGPCNIHIDIVMCRPARWKSTSCALFSRWRFNDVAEASLGLWFVCANMVHDCRPETHACSKPWAV